MTTTLGKIKCAFGIHQWMDLQRREEVLGQDVVEECLRCKKHRSGFRLFWGKDGPMHPRIQKA